MEKRASRSQPGNTGAAPPSINPDTSDQLCWPSAEDAEYCSTPCGAATYTVDGLAAIAVSGICRPRPGASEFTPSMFTYDTGCVASVRVTTMSSPVRQDNDTTDVPSPNPSRRGYVRAYCPAWVCSTLARITWPAITIAARVLSRDSCRSVIGPGNRLDTAPESTGMRAGWPDAGSWIARSTLLVSTTTHTASSSDQLGRERLCPSAGWTASALMAPIHRDSALSGAPRRSDTTDATSRPLRDSAALLWSPMRPKAPGTVLVFCPSRDTREPFTSACRPALAPSATPGSVAATSEVVHPSAKRSSSGAPSALITYGPRMSARARVQMICAASNCLLCGSVVDSFSGSPRAPP